MDLHVYRANVLTTLPEFRKGKYGLGALPLFPDSRLRDLRSIREVARQIEEGVPENADLTRYIGDPIYNQGQEDACVAYSIAGMESILENISAGSWDVFDAEELYRACGGMGSNGISAPDALNWDETVGLKDTDTNLRHRIGSFAFADPQSDNGVEAIKASIAANRPCVLALLLPDDFDNGDCYSDVVTTGYHQICLVGYDADRFTFLNSWSNSYGRNGLGSMAWSYLDLSAQTGYVYAYTISGLIDPNLAGFPWPGYMENIAHRQEQSRR